MKNKYLFFVMIALLAVGLYYAWKIGSKFGQRNIPPTTQNVPGGAFVPEKPTKTFACNLSNGLPDHACTPGAVNSNVSQDNIQSTICAPGFTKTVRPPVSYTDDLKKLQMQEYGLSGNTRNYEEDHLIPLELGGNPTDPANLWPEPRKQYPSATEKDRVENYLHQQVCAGKVSLAEAQKEISTNWVQVYDSVEGITKY